MCELLRKGHRFGRRKDGRPRRGKARRGDGLESQKRHCKTGKALVRTLHTTKTHTPLSTLGYIVLCTVYPPQSFPPKTSPPDTPPQTKQSGLFLWTWPRFPPYIRIKRYSMLYHFIFQIIGPFLLFIRSSSSFSIAPSLFLSRSLILLPFHLVLVLVPLLLAHCSLSFSTHQSRLSLASYYTVSP